MDNNSLGIMQINATDMNGGAATVVWNLHEMYNKMGHCSWLVVGQKKTNDPQVFPILNSVPLNRNWMREGITEGPQLHKRPVQNFRHTAIYFQAGMSALHRKIDRFLGREVFHYPGTWRLPELIPEEPDIIHCHNLHGDYFDLRELPMLSTHFPLVITLHDAWLLGGHCAHSLDCERWMRGCGSCPDLNIYPMIRRDSTKFNFIRKQQIYRRSKLHLICPCRWLIERLECSALSEGYIDAQHIPYGVDLSVFTPADRYKARDELGLPQDCLILLFSAIGLLRNPFKDFLTLRRALEQLSSRYPDTQILLIGLGESAPSEKLGKISVKFTRVEDRKQVPKFFHAADIYVHAAKADTYPIAILEALGCGLPVIATGVGGIPEQVKNGVTGFLVPKNDDHALSDQIETLMVDESLRLEMGKNARRDAIERFSLEMMVKKHLVYYRELLEG
jgi:glycosyltransferase involved in cell wall biosynthesis